MLLCCSVRGTSDQSYPPWPGWMVTTLLSYLTTGGLCKECGTNKLPPTWRIWKRSEGERRCQSLCATIWNPSWLSDTHTTRKDPESGWLAEVNLEANSIALKPAAANHASEQLSWVPLPCRPPPRLPFPVKSLAMSARVSPQAIYYPVLDKSPFLGPGKGLPSCHSTVCILWQERKNLDIEHFLYPLASSVPFTVHCVSAFCIGKTSPLTEILKVRVNSLSPVRRFETP